MRLWLFIFHKTICKRSNLWRVANTREEREVSNHFLFIWYDLDVWRLNFKFVKFCVHLEKIYNSSIQFHHYQFLPSHPKIPKACLCPYRVKLRHESKLARLCQILDELRNELRQRAAPAKKLRLTYELRPVAYVRTEATRAHRKSEKNLIFFKKCAIIYIEKKKRNNSNFLQKSK